jgi:hypothetical protein
MEEVDAFFAQVQAGLVSLFAQTESSVEQPYFVPRSSQSLRWEAVVELM